MKKKIVYWAPWFVPQEIHHWNMLFIEPQKLLNKVIDDIKNIDDDRLKGMIRCPAFSNVGKNTFYVENPMATEFNIVDGEIQYVGENFYYSTLSKGQNIFKYGLSYIFFLKMI